MRGVEAAPLVYIIAAIAVVIALGILVLMGGVVKKGVAGATETLNKSVMAGAQKVAQEVGGTVLGDDTITIYNVSNKSGHFMILFYVYRVKDATQVDIRVYDEGGTEKYKVKTGLVGICATTDADGDGLKNDLGCNYTNTTWNYTKPATVKATLLPVNKYHIYYITSQ